MALEIFIGYKYAPIIPFLMIKADLNDFLVVDKCFDSSS